MKKFSIFSLILTAFLVISGSLSLISCQKNDDRPSLIFITVDTLRADRLGCYGYFRDTSPFIDSFAEESVLFENCLTPMATTLPAHLSMFTSLNPYTHGVKANTEHLGCFHR